MSEASDFAESLKPGMCKALLALPEEEGVWISNREMRVSNLSLHALLTWDSRRYVCDRRWVDKDWREYTNQGCYEYSITSFGIEVREELKKQGV